MPYKDPVKQKAYFEKYRANNKDRQKEYDATRSEEHKKHAIESITSGKIADQHKWDMWCSKIKSSAPKHPYSECFTNDIMFEILIQGCFYCGDIATTIDRLDSKLDHTPENCVGSCYGCNNSKGTSDPSTFIKKAYYRVHGKYYDNDSDIWFVNARKPPMYQYIQRAKKKGVSFELTKETFEGLVIGDCGYCKRSPTKWFGVDRVVPSLGYVIDNVVSCCFDCNLDKFDGNVDTMIMRNERIARRVDDGELVIEDCDKLILHKGTHSSSKKVCTHGKLYASMYIASCINDKSGVYVSKCIRNENQTDDIFEISDEFYEEYKYSNMYITKNMFIAFEHFYTNI